MDSNLLLSVLEPVLQLETSFALDEETASAGNSGLVRTSRAIGSLAPYIMIGASTFTHENIIDMVLDESGFLPTLKVSIIDKSGSFSGAYFPKANPILSLYIRSKNNKYKAIRSDYLITKINPSGSLLGLGAAEGAGMRYYISGVLFMPDIFSPISKSYPNMTTLELMHKLASELQIGLLTNESQTNDSMTWINPYWQYSRMLKYASDHAYKDDRSFFATYIDKYYFLNFVNVDGMLSQEDSFDEMWYSLNHYEDYTKASGSDGKGYENNLTEAKPDILYLTNFSPMIKSDIFIKEIKPSSNVGAIYANIGAYGLVYYYDNFLAQKGQSLSNNFVNFDMRPNLPIQYENADMRGSASGYWEGIDYNNNHDHFVWAKYNNYLNIVSMNQMTLEVVLNGVNLSLHRGQRIPVLIVREGKDASASYGAEVNLAEEDSTLSAAQKNTRIYRDMYLSGYYVITRIRYNFKAFTDKEDTMDHNFFTEVTLARKTWPKVRSAKENLQQNTTS